MTAEEPNGSPLVVRNRAAIAWSASTSLLVGCAVCLLVGTILLQEASAPKPAVFAAGAVVVVAAVLRSRRIRLVVGDQIEIDNYWRSSVLEWSEVEQIIAMSSSPGVFTADSLAFQRKDGWLFPAHATAVTGPREHREALLLKLAAKAQRHNVLCRVTLIDVFGGVVWNTTEDAWAPALDEKRYRGG